MKENAMGGRILKIKTGYNPNSSGIGVDVVVFFTAGAALTILFNTAAAIVGATQAQQEEGSREGSKEPSGPGRREEQG